MIQVEYGLIPELRILQIWMRISADASAETNVLQLTPALNVSIGLNWISKLVTQSENGEPRLVLVDSDQLLLSPLIEHLLLAPNQTFRLSGTASCYTTSQ